MREILFRGKRVENMERVEGFIIAFSDAPARMYTNRGQFFVDPATVSQYTGLKDKNGIKIFEGDILGFNDESEWFYIVTWKPAGFGYTVNKGIETGSAVYSFDREQLKLMEITGNIHEVKP